MSIKKGTPGKGGGTPRREQFVYTNTPAGLKHAWTGWMACEAYWCKGHEHKPPGQIGTKPCLTWMTDGAVHCPWCKPNSVTKDIGYCHVWREMDGWPCLVIVHDSVADLMAGLDYGSHVLVGRVESTSSSFVKSSEARLPWKSNLEHRQRAIDFEASLLGIWNIPCLTTWCQKGAAAAKSDNAVSMPVAGKPVAGWKRFVELGSVGAMSGGVEGASESANQRFVREHGAAPAPSKNGKHKQPQEE